MRFAITFGLLLSVACASKPATPTGGDATVRARLTQALPTLKGDSLKVTILEVEYAPGGSSAAHRHPCAVLGYVVEGALRSQSEGGPDSVYRAGESFYEAPNAAHVISANASNTERVLFTATFICDVQGPLTSAVQ